MSNPTTIPDSFTQHERAIAAKVLACKGGQFVAIDYTDSKGEGTTRTVQVGVDIQAAHEKRGGFTGAGSWSTDADHIGPNGRIAINKNGRPSLRALCTLRNEMRFFRLDAISGFHAKNID